MKLIILTQYFPPETGAPQNRLFELAVRILRQGHEVTVLTAMPNYPSMTIHAGYRGKWCVKENIQGINVIRSAIYVSKKRGIASRLLNYFSFVFSSIMVGTRHLPHADFLLVESPPLFLGVSGWLLAKIKHAGFIFNVSDLWPESAEKLGIVTNRIFLKAAYLLEAFLYKRSVLITGQTQGIVADINRRFPSKKVYWLKNGVDASLFNPNDYQRDWRKEAGYKEADLLFLYAGILGHAQGLETVLECANLLRGYNQIQFALMGTGPEEVMLKETASRLGLTNVRFFPNQPKTMMPRVIQSCDVAIVHLLPLDLFLGAIPSKIFENLAMSKPVLLGVDGEAKDLFVNNGQCALFSKPGDANHMASAVLKLSGDAELREKLGLNGRKFVQTVFNRDSIATDLLNLLKSIPRNSKTSNPNNQSAKP